jgi:hypothetical protein
MCAVKVTMWAHHGRADCGYQIPNSNQWLLHCFKDFFANNKKKEEDFEVIIYIYIRVYL